MDKSFFFYFLFFFILFALPKKYAKTLDKNILPRTYPRLARIFVDPTRGVNGMVIQVQFLPICLLSVFLQPFYVSLFNSNIYNKKSEVIQ
jgi:hypothetical protein